MKQARLNILKKDQMNTFTEQKLKNNTGRNIKTTDTIYVQQTETNTQTPIGYKNHLLLVVPASQIGLVEGGKDYHPGQTVDEGP